VRVPPRVLFLHPSLIPACHSAQSSAASAAAFVAATVAAPAVSYHPVAVAAGALRQS